MMKRTCIALFLVLLAGALFAQRNMYERKNREVFPDLLQYKPGGWYIAPGLTYMMTRFASTTDPETNITYAPRGRFGLYFEAGRYRILEYSYLFRYLDYGLAYKGLRGKETAGGVESKFGDHFITGHFNLNNVINVSDNSFISNTVGLNADYSIIRNVPGTAPPQFIGQLHYKLGFGFKASSRLLIIPSIETPILNLYPFEFPRSSLGYFNSRYRPLIFSVRFLWFRPRKDECPPVYNPMMPDGYDPEGVY